MKIIKSVPILGITKETFTLYATNEGFLSTFRHIGLILLLTTIWPVVLLSLAQYIDLHLVIITTSAPLYKE